MGAIVLGIVWWLSGELAADVILAPVRGWPMLGWLAQYGWAIVAMFAVGLLVAIWRETKTAATDTEVRPEVVRIQNILQKMHKRTLKLKDKAVAQYMKLFTLKDFREFTDTLIDMTSRENRELLRDIKKDIGKKRLSKDRVKKRQQVDNLVERLKPIWDKEWILGDVVAWSNMVDKLPKMQNEHYEGIISRRERDRQWKRLLDQLNNLKLEFADVFADEDLERMIADYLNSSLSYSSVSFMVILHNRFTKTEILPSVYIESGTSAPDTETETRMTKLLKDISNKIAGVKNGNDNL